MDRYETPVMEIEELDEDAILTSGYHDYVD